MKRCCKIRPSHLLGPKACFKRRTSHVPNLMLMRKFYCFTLFALVRRMHVKFDVDRPKSTYVLKQFTVFEEFLFHVFFPKALINGVLYFPFIRYLFMFNLVGRR